VTPRGTLALFAAAGVTLAHATPGCVEERADRIVVVHCVDRGLTVVETQRSLELIYHAVAPPTPRQLAAAGWAVVVNGSYHDGDYANAMLEGQFTVRGKHWGVARPDDRQLSHVVAFDTQGRIESIAPADAAALARATAAAASVQTGPLITENGRWVEAYARQSLNGVDAYKRSAVGRTGEGASVIVIARQPRTLEALARDVLALRRYAQRGLTLVNLDGGPSTALALARWPQWHYQPDKLTPVAIGVRP
jgi:Phosphodiester glycosidase